MGVFGLHCFPPVRREQEMYDMVVLVALATQVAVDHLADRCRPI